MSSRPWGYRRGPYVVQKFLMDSGGAAAVVPGDFVILGTAGYVQVATAGDQPIGVAVSGGADPSADGQAEVLVSIDPDAVYEYPPDTGTCTQALKFAACDVGGAQSANIDSSTTGPATDGCLHIVDVDLDRNTVFVKIMFTPAGV